jgi:serine/threonine-protein kinase
LQNETAEAEDTPSSSANLQSAICNLQSEQTHPGSVLGTPAYVAPEQASGQTERLDQRSDVFGLGAILCEILTGKPPYVGADLFQVQRLAAGADLADARARLENCGADAELVGLALACLAPRPADRPKDAQEVADTLTAYLDGVQDRLRRAELAEAEARTRAAEEAKRRRLALALAATVLLAVSAGGAAALWLQADRQAQQTQLQARQAELTREVNDALQRVTALREQAKTATTGSAALFAQAREQATRAHALVQTGPADETLTLQVRHVQQELDEEEKDRRFIAAIDAAYLAGAETETAQGRFATERAVPLFREAFRAYGLPAGEGVPSAAAARLHQRPPQVRKVASAALEEWIDLVTNPRRRIREPHLDWLRAVAVAEPADGLTRDMRAASEETDLSKQRVALEKLAAAVDVSKLPPLTLTRLARRLRAAQATSSAVRLLLRVRQQYPDDFWVHHYLGFWFLNSEPPRPAEAARYYTAAVALRPSSPGVHLNLGVALDMAGQYDEAIACFEKAIALDPRYAPAHDNLGGSLLSKGQPDQAIPYFKKAMALDPKLASPHNNLGSALYVKGKVKEAITCYRQALALHPNYPQALFNLGVVLTGTGKQDEAIACFRKTIALAPMHAHAYYNLGNVLYAQGKDDEAILCFKKTIELAPLYPEGHCNLGQTLLERGDFAEALISLQRGHELGTRRGGWTYPTPQWIRRCQQLIEREKQLLDVLAGKSAPAGARERLEWARLSMQTRRYVGAARLWSEAFAAEAKLADDLKAGYRFQAARAAVLAATGKGRDAGGLDDAQKTELRKQALTWLKADLAARAKQPAGERSAELGRWQADEALAAVRSEQALPQDERASWSEFWSEVQKHLRDESRR